MVKKSLQAIFLFSLVFLTGLSHSLPLSTNKRWIVDAASGQRVKLACVNWAAHLQPMLAEGLDKKPLKGIVARVARMHFNCVRLTWPTFMLTRANYGRVTIANTLDVLGLEKAKKGIARNNPFVLNMTHIQAYEAVVDELGAQGIMVLLDNHISKPEWCCSNTDGNGFFGDIYFHPQEWLRGLTIIAERFKSKKQVVAVSMRNELRGSRQNEHDWYKYIGKGARAVHKANPNVLILVSGVSFDTDLGFLQERTLDLDLKKKIVYEIHWYSFSGDQAMWELQPLNRVCHKYTQSFIRNSAFLTYGENPVPLFLSEFGFDQTGNTSADNWFMTCLMAYVSERDLDWSLWALQGSYYLRQGRIGDDESYGTLDYQWHLPRNASFIRRLRLMQTMTQDPNSNLSKSYILYHPESGNAVNANGRNEIHDGSSEYWSRWSYDGDGAPIRLMGTALCLNVVGDGLPTMLSNDCLSQQSAWTVVSHSKLQLAARDAHGELLCLQKPSNSSRILTRRCICVEDDSRCMENPQSQWFKFVLTNVE